MDVDTIFAILLGSAGTTPAEFKILSNNNQKQLLEKIVDQLRMNIARLNATCIEAQPDTETHAMIAENIAVNHQDLALLSEKLRDLMILIAEDERINAIIAVKIVQSLNEELRAKNTVDAQAVDAKATFNANTPFTYQIDAQRVKAVELLNEGDRLIAKGDICGEGVPLINNLRSLLMQTSQ